MQKPSRRRKMFISEHVSVVNLDPTVMTLPFEANIDIRDTVRYKDVMKEYGRGPNGGILTSLKGEDFFNGTKVVLLHHILISHRVANIMLAPNNSVITAWSRLTTDTCSEIKIFFTS
jgi:GTPase SAR1 family protein